MSGSPPEAPQAGSFARYGLILGALTSLGPLATDMYLPGLPRLASDLGTTPGAAQLSVMSFFAGLTAGQVVYGPMSDKFGRKPPIFLGLVLFVLGSIGCALATGILPLIALRFLQGGGGCVGMIVGSAIVRDLYTGLPAVRLLSTIILVRGVAPILAPLAGSIVVVAASWRAIFAVHAVVGLGCIGLVATLMPETRSREARAGVRLGRSFGHFFVLLRDARFVAPVLVAGLAQAGFFAYLAGSAFALMSVHHLSPVAYSILFGVNAVGLIGATQLNAPLIRRFGAIRLVVIATGVNAAAAATLCALSLLGLASLPATAVLLFLCVSCLAFILAPCNMLALQPLGAVAGTASALMGFLQYGCGVAASALVGLLADGTMIPMVGVIAACGAGAFATSCGAGAFATSCGARFRHSGTE